MDRILLEKHRERLINAFTKVARNDLLTNEDGLVILELLGRACKRAAVDLDEEMLREMINGSEEDPTPGSGE